MLWIFSLLALLAFLHLLYLQGVISIACKRSLVFLGTPGNSSKNFYRASVIGCTGTIRRVLRFPKGGEYCFSLTLQADKGGMEALLLDKGKSLRLDGQTCQGRLVFSPGESCRLVLIFSHMDGSFSLDWKPSRP